MADIRLREQVKDIKVFDRAADVGRSMKSVAVRTKDAVESEDRQAAQIQESGYSSPSEYAAGHVTDSVRYIAVRAKDGIDNQTRKTVDKLNRARRNAAKAKRQAENAKTAVRNSAQTADKSVRAVSRSRRASERTIKTASKTIKGSARNAQKAVKTAEVTAKVTAKASQQAVKATQKAAQAAAQAARAAAKATVTAVKVAVKVVVATVKAIIAAAKALVTAIAAGGWVAVVIILVIVLIALLLGSVFGIFFSGEDSGSGYTMPAVVAELSQEFYKRIEDIKDNTRYDVVIVEAMMINWQDILAVYAVSVSTGAVDPMDVATLDAAKVERLRRIQNDMVKLSYYLTEETHEQTVIDDDGNEFIEEVTVVTLVITMTRKTADEAAAKYGFNKKQLAQLHELQDPKYADLWALLIGSYYLGSGEILIGNPDHIPLDIYSWPLAGDFPVISGFGYRKDPFTGEFAYHEGIDISAPEGTPILAAADGTVIIANSTDLWGGGWGLHVKIQHQGSYATLYAHCSRIAVVNGQTVKKGQVIGYVGSTGRSTGNHLHWECYVGGVRVDPMGFFA